MLVNVYNTSFFNFERTVSQFQTSQGQSAGAKKSKPRSWTSSKSNKQEIKQKLNKTVECQALVIWSNISLNTWLSNTTNQQVNI